MSGSKRSEQLHAWMQRLEALDPAHMELGLERVRAVLAQGGLDALPQPIVLVGGTNGKGSTVRLLDAIWSAAGHRVGSYTSPHLRRVNERIRIAGEDIGDNSLCLALEAVEKMRGAINLTYFEFLTVAALLAFRDAAVDVIVLEVGLGGRLDAVNAVQPTLSVITNVALDHQVWLGDCRDSIGREKAGILRANQPAIYGEMLMPDSVRQVATELATPLRQLGQGFGWGALEKSWSYWSDEGYRLDTLPWPFDGACVLDNAALAVDVVHCLSGLLAADDEALRRGLAEARLPGRQQLLAGEPPILLDVAHNVAAVEQLAERLRDEPVAGRNIAVVGMLADKPAADIVAVLADLVHSWHAAGLPGPRGLTGAALAEELKLECQTHADVATALQAARAEAGPGDRLVVFGSFVTVGAALEILEPLAVTK